MNRSKRRVPLFKNLVLCLMGILLLLFIFYSGYARNMHQDEIISRLKWEQVTVKPGQCIWQFAGVSEEIDRRILVDEIMRRNGCGATLQVGQRLEVPICR